MSFQILSTLEIIISKCSASISHPILLKSGPYSPNKKRPLSRRVEEDIGAPLSGLITLQVEIFFRVVQLFCVFMNIYHQYEENPVYCVAKFKFLNFVKVAGPDFLYAALSSSLVTV